MFIFEAITMSKAGQLARLLNHIDDDYARRDGSSMTGALVVNFIIKT